MSRRRNITQENSARRHAEKFSALSTIVWRANTHSRRCLTSSAKPISLDKTCLPSDPIHPQSTPWPDPIFGLHLCHFHALDRPYHHTVNFRGLLSLPPCACARARSSVSKSPASSDQLGLGAPRHRSASLTCSLGNHVMSASTGKQEAKFFDSYWPMLGAGNLVIGSGLPSTAPP